MFPVLGELCIVICPCAVKKQSKISRSLMGFHWVTRLGLIIKIIEVGIQSFFFLSLSLSLCIFFSRKSDRGNCLVCLNGSYILYVPALGYTSRRIIILILVVHNELPLNVNELINHFSPSNIYPIHILSENLIFICTSFRNRCKYKPSENLSDPFHSRCKYKPSENLSDPFHSKCK